MQLTCDLCGGMLTENADRTAAVCDNCGLEYGPDRLQEKRASLQPAEPVKTEKQTPETDKKPAKKSSKRGITLTVLGILAVLSLLSGVAVTALIFGIAMVLILLLWKPNKQKKSD
jgi:hypothetical protein